MPSAWELVAVSFDSYACSDSGTVPFVEDKVGWKLGSAAKQNFTEQRRNRRSER